MKLKKIEENTGQNIYDEKLIKEFKERQRDMLLRNLNTEINLHLSNDSLTEEEKARLNELKSRIEEMKQFNIDSFMYFLQKKFDTFLIEIAEQSNNRINENRLNTFLLNFELLREKSLAVKQEERKKLKLNALPNKLIWHPVLTEFQ